MAGSPASLEIIMEYLVMLPGPTNVPNRVMNAMLAPVINHRSDDFRMLYKSIVERTQKVFQTSNDIVLLTTSGTGAVEELAARSCSLRGYELVASEYGSPEPDHAQEQTVFHREI